MKCHRRLKEMKSGSGAKKIRKCDFYDEMLFLTKIVTRRDTESNIPETTNVGKSPVEHTPIAKKKKQDVSEVDKNMAEFIKAVTKEEESRAMSFFKSIAPSVDKFSDEEMVDFQFEVLKLVRSTQQRKGSDVQHQWSTEYYNRHLTYPAHHTRLDQVTVLKNLHPLNLTPKLLVVWKHRIQMNFTLTFLKNMNMWSLLNLETCKTSKTFIIV